MTILIGGVYFGLILSLLAIIGVGIMGIYMW